MSASRGGQGLFGYFEEDRDTIVAVAFSEEWQAFVLDRLRMPDLLDVAPRMFKAWVAPNTGAVEPRTRTSKRRRHDPLARPA